MPRGINNWLFAVVALLGALLALFGLLQHFMLQVEVLHLALYTLALGVVLFGVGLVGLGVSMTRRRA